MQLLHLSDAAYQQTAGLHLISVAAHTSTVMRDIGIASGREPDVRRDESRRAINLTFRGTSDARSSVDHDARLRIAMPPAQAAWLWHLLGQQLTEEEKQRADPGMVN
jgi:hypothetical protein